MHPIHKQYVKVYFHIGVLAGVEFTIFSYKKFNNINNVGYTCTVKRGITICIFCKWTIIVLCEKCSHKVKITTLASCVQKCCFGLLWSQSGTWLILSRSWSRMINWRRVSVSVPHSILEIHLVFYNFLFPKGNLLHQHDHLGKQRAIMNFGQLGTQSHP